MDKARLFGECPQFTFTGATGLITVGSTTLAGGVAPAKGVAAILILADTIFAVIEFSCPQDGSASLVGITIPAGVTLYGVRSYQITSGVGIAYHSHA
jgi:hypothetical protein